LLYGTILTFSVNNLFY